MKKLSLLICTFATFSVNLFGYTLSGTAATSAINIAAGNSSFVIVDTTGGDTLDSDFFTAGTTLTAGTSVGNYYIAAQNAVAGTFGVTVPGNATFTLGDGSTTGGDYFYVVAFGTNTGDNITLSVGDTFGLNRGIDWNLGSNTSATESYGPQFQQLSTVNGAQFSVVPEPSAYAALAGILALSCVMLRRRA
jgi:hypothetical protein